MKCVLAIFAALSMVCAQEGLPPTSIGNPVPPELQGIDWVCPMDKDVHSPVPGFCPRCGMKLVPWIPEPDEYPVVLTTSPRVLKAGEDIQLDFKVEEPHTHKPVRDFQIVHDRLFHLFIASQDTTVFVHEHPEFLEDGSFRYHARFPKPGAYRIVCDFYPKGGTPQFILKTLMVPGAGFKLATAQLEPNLAPQHSENLDVELVTEPAQPVAGLRTLMFFRLKPDDGIEQYLSAWAHMLAASSDLIDMIHDHPVLVSDPENGAYKQIQFTIVFPREGVYRLWVQFQRKGVVNTVAFNVPVIQLK